MKKKVLVMYNIKLVSLYKGNENNLVFQYSGVVTTTPGNWDQFFLDEAIDLYKKHDIDFFLFTEEDVCKNMDLFMPLINADVKHYDILVAKDEFINNPVQENIVPLEKCAYLPYIEYHITDNCNLKCKGCTHFSNLVTEPSFKTMEQICAEIELLHDKISDIKEIRILGGEPLLHKDIVNVIKIIGTILYDVNIVIVTNGLLISDMTQEFFEVCKQFSVIIKLSMYKPTIKIYRDRILPILVKNDICALYTKYIDRFEYIFSRSESDRKPVCSCAIFNYHNRKIYRCPMQAYYYRFADKFGLEYRDLGYSLENFNYGEFLTWICKDEKFCKYCIGHAAGPLSKQQEWSNNVDVDIYDWIWKG